MKQLFGGCVQMKTIEMSYKKIFYNGFIDLELVYK